MACVTVGPAGGMAGAARWSGESHGAVVGVARMVGVSGVSGSRLMTCWGVVLGAAATGMPAHIMACWRLRSSVLGGTASGGGGVLTRAFGWVKGWVGEMVRGGGG
eukprot:11036766-Alexandrium_andersonii.AAC.1